MSTKTFGLVEEQRDDPIINSIILKYP